MDATPHKHTNKLIHQSSPYLLQHAHNPVDWYPWGAEALEKAQQENKLILVSVGYAACHWCHVMERECFENEAIADIMNKHFVCIKVDREERPDIDQVYMSAVQLLTGAGGWPLNCFALPNGNPVWGGTYFRPSQWESILNSLSASYASEPQKFVDQAENLLKGIATSEVSEKNTDDLTFTNNTLELTYQKWEPLFDFKDGGNKKAPKFPLPNSLQFLLNIAYYTNNEKALNHLENSLDKMAKGGIYDQVGGGFSRYATDERWKIPHFEKMLYDNGQLVSLYAEAWLQTKKPLYKDVVYQTIDFVERELMSDEYGFYSSLDADSEGVEGKFYVWTEKELQSLLKEDAALVADYYSVTPTGNWEHSNILHIQKDAQVIAQQYNIGIDVFYKKIENAKKTLLQEREKRIRPGLDDKILTSWNALMLKGYIDAYKAFGEEKFLNTALKNAAFIQNNLVNNDYSLYRNYKNKQTTINGFLDDYSLLAEAYIALYQISGDTQWLNTAKGLCDYAITHFYDETTGMYFYTSDIDPPLAARKMEVTDNVMPGSNSSLAKVLYLLGIYYYNDDYHKRSEQMLKNVIEQIPVYGTYFSNWGQLLTWFANPPFELVVSGKDALKYVHLIDSYRPDVIIAVGEKETDIPIFENRFNEDKTTFYICRNRVCKNPVFSAEDAIQLLDK